jgi:hypothetical protein
MGRFYAHRFCHASTTLELGIMTNLKFRVVVLIHIMSSPASLSSSSSSSTFCSPASSVPNVPTISLASIPPVPTISDLVEQRLISIRSRYPSLNEDELYDKAFAQVTREQEFKLTLDRKHLAAIAQQTNNSRTTGNCQLLHNVHAYVCTIYLYIFICMTLCMIYSFEHVIIKCIVGYF